jgi:predicted metal-dependent HD superfamily phosphohydrolase
MLGCHERYRPLTRDQTVIALAIFFHDWIYDPRAKDNELESIKSLQAFAAEINLSKSIVTPVSEYIERTITHTLPATDVAPGSDLCLFLDFDLEVLSRNATDYASYAANIRQEYSSYSDIEYWQGRIKVLRAFLARERLYFSDVFYEECESAARANLRDEIEDLQQKIDAL